MNKLEGKVILVTGASGFIGRHLVKRLFRIADAKLLLLSRQCRQSSQKNVLWLKAEMSQLSPEYWKHRDISHIDYVFHLGAFIPKKSMDANLISRAVDDNILATRALLQSLPGKLDKLIFSSTIDVYAPKEHGELVTEGSRVSPSTLYGASKLFCENLISAWAAEVSCNYAVLRYGHIYGPGEEQFAKLIPIVIRTLLANQSPVIYGNGSTLRDFLFVGDAVEATIRSAVIEGNVEPINIVRGESVTVEEIVLLLKRMVGSKVGINYLLDKPNGISLRFDNRQMSKILGNWSMTGLEDGLALEVEGFRRTENA